MAEFTKEQLIGDLRCLGVVEGDHLGVGLSFKSIGTVVSGPDALIDALLEAVGPEGTIMMPTDTSSFPIHKAKAMDYIFDHRITSGNTGIVPEVFRKREGAIRSRHPTSSVAAMGRLASRLTEGHDEKSSAYSPYSRLAESKGKILCIGIGDNMVGFRHEAQFLAGLLDIVPLRRAVKYRKEDAEIGLFIRRDKGGCVRKLPDLVKPLREHGFVADGYVGKANSILASARECLEMMTQNLKDHPEMNLCRNIKCLWCRELERRLDLYERVNNPEYFQKNIVIIKGVYLCNWLRLNMNRY
jgi:aminoglycoside 3-N-acetyltransferase